MEKLLTAQQVADGLGYHVKTLYKLVRENRIALPFIQKHGRMIAFRPSDVQRYLDLHEVTRDGTNKTKKKRNTKAHNKANGFLSDKEAQAFFERCEKDEDGNIIDIGCLDEDEKATLMEILSLKKNQ